VDFGSPVPRPSVVTQGWGEPRPHRDGVHEGFDYPVKIGTPIFSVGEGTVITSASTDDPGGAGIMISVAHPNGIISRYLHLDKRLVEKGERVSKGQFIAKSGASGIKQSAAHLHFDLKIKPDKLAEYTSRFGTPVGGFGSTRFGLIGIPAEPLIPVDRYAERVKEGAGKFGIPLYAAGGGLGLILVGVGGFVAWRALKKR